MKLIKPFAVSLLLVFGGFVSLFAQNREVSGTVLDAQQQPVIGAAVFLIDGGNAGSITDIDGNFVLSVPAGDITLDVTCLGYVSKVVKVPSTQSFVTVVLEEDTMLLEETVVVGYGTQKKVNLTGAVSVVESKSIENRSAANLGNILQGTVPGLTVTSASGRPGQGTSINIRGWNSINTGNPLVLVDGVEGDLSRVNPNDVESISVVKDASSAAVYGARASFGVILVTTKSGASSEEDYATVRYSGRYGFTTPTASTDWETRGYYSVYYNNLFHENYNGAQAVTYTDADMVELWNRRNDKVENPERPWVVIDQRMGRDTYVYYGNTDWWHYWFNDIKPTQSHNVSFSGGTKKMKYFLSGNYNKEQGMFRQNPDIYNRYNLRSRLTFDVTKWLNISNNTSYFQSSYTYPGFSNLNSTVYYTTASAFACLVPINPDGTVVGKNDYTSNAIGAGINTILHNENFKNTQTENHMQTSTEVTIKPFKQLEIKGNYTYSYASTAYLQRSVNNDYSQIPGIIETVKTGGEGEDKLYERINSHTFHSANIFGTYTDTFNEKHNLKVMAGFNYETKHLKDVKLTGYNLLSQSLNDQNLIGDTFTTDPATGLPVGEKRMETGGGQNEYATAGFFGRLNYDYMGKYLLEMSGRYDGTSRFKRGQRWGFFPSASVGWRISEEDFFAPAKSWWDNFKVRYSFGSLGNQQVGYYDYIREVSLSNGSYLFGGSKPLTAGLGAPVASTLTWETVQQHNVGIDLAFLGNRLTFTGEAYVRDTKNMLTTGQALPSVYGASAPKTNNADLRTQGYELSLSWRDAIILGGSPLEYDVTATFNDYIGFITKFDNPEKTFAKSYYEGMVYGEIWGYKTDGFFATDEEAANYPVDQTSVNYIISTTGGLKAGDLKYVDLDGDGKISRGANTVDKPGDRVIIGNSQPRFQYGLNLGMRWKGFDFSIFFQGIGRMHWYPTGDARFFWGPYSRPWTTYVRDNFSDMYWSEENPNAYFPRPRGYIAHSSDDSKGQGRALSTPNDRYLQDLAYCRLKNLTFGYSLPKKWMDKANMEAVRVYFSGENLGYYAPGFHTEHMDPESAKQGDKSHIYPWQKTFMFGIDITF